MDTKRSEEAADSRRWTQIRGEVGVEEAEEEEYRTERRRLSQRRCGRGEEKPQMDADERRSEEETEERKRRTNKEQNVQDVRFEGQSGCRRVYEDSAAHSPRDVVEPRGCRLGVLRGLRGSLFSRGRLHK
ncbi:MAG: hypothetical protein KF869_09945 [Phycisphaeraceae bacterium]|nr:hypothetical protein [Phycisphaeraceae bacterium]